MTVTHCIFDMDGLLLDTETFYTHVQKVILARFGKEFSWDLKAKMMGQKALPAAEILVQELGLEDKLSPEAFLAEREDMLCNLFPSAQLLPGVKRLLTHLKRHNIPSCVATSSKQLHVDLKTKNHQEVFSLFDHIVSGDHVEKGKPHPEIFLKAVAQWPEPPPVENCLIFEDAPSGVAAANAAGIRCVMVPDPAMERSSIVGATEVIDSLEQFAPEKYGLPAFE